MQLKSGCRRLAHLVPVGMRPAQFMSKQAKQVVLPAAPSPMEDQDDDAHRVSPRSSKAIVQHEDTLA